MLKSYESFVPGAVARIQKGEPTNNVRTEPGVAAPVIGLLPAGDLLVVLQPPAGWEQDYPYENDGHVWVYVYAVARRAVGWTAAGPINASNPAGRFMDVMDPSYLAA